MTLVLFGLAMAVGLAQEQVVSNLKRSTHAVKRGGGAILILVGAWLVILAVWADVFARIFPV
jgi:cytochrome c biogenesis protein CcdA